MISAKHGNVRGFKTILTVVCEVMKNFRINCFMTIAMNLLKVRHLNPLHYFSPFKSLNSVSCSISARASFTFP